MLPYRRKRKRRTASRSASPRAHGSLHREENGDRQQAVYVQGSGQQVFKAYVNGQEVEGKALQQLVGAWKGSILDAVKNTLDAISDATPATQEQDGTGQDGQEENTSKTG